MGVLAAAAAVMHELASSQHDIVDIAGVVLDIVVVGPVSSARCMAGIVD
jgi:hypothetical protein